MSATYTIRIAVLATGVDGKWLDNLLSHHRLPGVAGGRQGLERSISMEGLLAIQVVRAATFELGLPVRRSAEIAATIIGSSSPDGRYRSASGVELYFPLEEFGRRLRERLVDAVEAAPNPARGRPRLR